MHLHVVPALAGPDRLKAELHTIPLRFLAIKRAQQWEEGIHESRWSDTLSWGVGDEPEAVEP